MNKKAINQNHQQSITAIVIAKDEEEKIGDCIESLDWCDETIVVDSGSIDKTKKVAKEKGANVFESEGGSFSDWRNKGAKRASGDWLLYVDADERVPPLLRKEIQKMINDKWKMENSCSAYAIPRKNFVLGKEMKHVGLWPDHVKRLFKARMFKKWTGELHEEPQFEGDLGHLKHPLIHLKHDKLSEMVTKTNEWSETEAKLMYEARHPKMNVIRFSTAMAREFWLRMIKQTAFLDGTRGIIYAIYQVFSRFLSYAKLWEMQTDNSKLKVKSSKL